MRKRYAARRQREHIPPVSPAPTHEHFQPDIGGAGIDTRREGAEVIGRPFSIGTEVEDVKVSERFHRVKSPLLEAWKKGVVPSLDHLDKSANNERQ